MARAHFARPVQDEMGNVLSDLVVRVIDPDSNANLTEPVYLSALGSEPAPQPITFGDGVIDFYLEEPRRVRLGVTQGAAPEVFYEDIDVLVASGDEVDAADVTFTPEGTIEATDVQAALAELDGDIQALSSDIIPAPLASPPEGRDDALWLVTDEPAIVGGEGGSLRWWDADNSQWVTFPAPADTPVLYRGNHDDGPPTDGSPFWFVPDGTCT